MKDIALDPITHDLTLGTDLSLVERIDYVVQKVKIRLWFFLGEWFLDTTEGTPFYQLVFVKGSKMEHIDAVMKDRILGSTGVRALKSYSSSFDRARRRLSIRFEAQGDDGATGNVTVEVP